ncbi:MAG: hypothetical protein NC078_03375, partial [Ruminococcus sp.]|nr:hypothetical protein [Ruminococcus sp.]
SVMISLLETGIVCLVYTSLLLMARVTGVHTAMNVILIPEKFSAGFVISAAAILIGCYVGSTPLYFGIRWFFWQSSDMGDVMPVSSVFACYSSHEMRMKCYKIRLAVDIRRLGWGLLFGGAAAAEMCLALVLWQNSAKGENLRFWLTFGCIVMMLGAVVLYMMFTIKYIPMGYLMAAEPYAEAKKIVSMCKETSKKKTFYIFCMYLGNIRHAPLMLFIFPIFVLRPYTMMMTAEALRDSLNS